MEEEEEVVQSIESRELVRSWLMLCGNGGGVKMKMR
jgi:hypothetical protein